MPGQVVHVEIPAGDTSKASDFWSSLFGWQFQSYEGSSDYHMAQLSEQMGAALYGAEGDQRGMRVYFDVDDIKATTAQIKDLGGDAGDPGPVPGMGWFSICKDNEGNEFGLWQSDASAPTSGQ